MSSVEKEEKRYFLLLIAVVIAVNAVTLSPLIPWQEWLLWTRPTPSATFYITIQNHTFSLPAGGITIKVGEPVQFIVTSRDVTYGFGIFHQSGRMIFQMQVLPHYNNSITWIFDEAGHYTIRSTEYSGPEHPQMVLPDAILVET